LRITHSAQYTIKRFLYLLVTSVTWATLFYYGLNGFLAFCLAFLLGQVCVSFLIWPNVRTATASPTEASLKVHRRSVYLSMMVALLLAALLFVVIYVL
jgi:hypothetical protein